MSETSMAEAVAASAAVPFVYEPVRIHDRWYADGGMGSGTSADLLLAHPEPLDLVIIVAPFAATAPRSGGRIYEDMFDRVGRKALAAELKLIATEWPSTDVVVLRPDESVLDVSRPNPMSAGAAIPTFLATLRSMQHELARSSTWRTLTRHLVSVRDAG
jgi:predicted acylesterase/phospholipase RssA